jgi:hypothetical protein
MSERRTSPAKPTLAAVAAPSPEPRAQRISSEHLLVRLTQRSIPHSDREATLTQLVAAIASSLEVPARGLGRWSDRVVIPPLPKNYWDAGQILTAASHESGRFGWRVEDGTIAVYRVSRGEPVFLEAEGVVVRLLPDRRTIEVRDGNGTVLWSADALAGASTEDLPAAERVVWRLYFCDRGNIVFDYGRKSYGVLDARTGDVLERGSD